jgi:hypothetical protein
MRHRKDEAHPPAKAQGEETMSAIARAGWFWERQESQKLKDSAFF